MPSPDSFYLINADEIILVKEKKRDTLGTSLAELFEKKISIDQKRGLDIVEISAESHSPL